MNFLPFQRTIFHVDVDAFFASVEQVIRPHLRGRPVVVGGMPNERSVVASASYEARKLGVRTAMPLARAYRICPEAAFLKGSFRNYARASEKIFEICRAFTPILETISLDEAFLDMTGAVDARPESERRTSSLRTLFGSPIETAARLKAEVSAVTGLSVSIGVASNKLIAKIASDYAKPGGIALVSPGYEAAFLSSMHVKEIPGVGRATCDRLTLLNTSRVDQLRNIPKELLCKTFGSAGETLFNHVRGRDPGVVEARALPKSISRETTFEEDTCDRELVEGMLSYLLARTARELRALSMRARTVSVKLRYADFTTLAKSASLTEPGRHDDVFYRTALELLNTLWHKRMRVRLVGVTLSKLYPTVEHQGRLFEERLYEKEENLYRSVDRIRDRFGFSAITQGRSIDLVGRLPKDRHGFQLRTPSLTQ